MKRILCLILILFTLLLSGCSSDTKTSDSENHVFIETHGDLITTYIYNYDNSKVLSKNTYDNITGITTEYSYYYHNNGWGTQLVGTSIVVISKEGEIISQFTTEN